MLRAIKPLKLAYCDFIASKIRQALLSTSQNSNEVVGLSRVHPVKWDFSEDGRLLSTKKTMLVSDANDKWYRVTVEEVL